MPSCRRPSCTCRPCSRSAGSKRGASTTRRGPRRRPRGRSAQGARAPVPRRARRRPERAGPPAWPCPERADHLLDTADRGLAHRVTRLLREMLRAESVLQLVDGLAHVLARPLDLLADLLSGRHCSASRRLPSRWPRSRPVGSSRRCRSPVAPGPARRAHAAWDIDVVEFRRGERCRVRQVRCEGRSDRRDYLVSFFSHCAVSLIESIVSTGAIGCRSLPSPLRTSTYPTAASSTVVRPAAAHASRPELHEQQHDGGGEGQQRRIDHRPPAPSMAPARPACVAFCDSSVFASCTSWRMRSEVCCDRSANRSPSDRSGRVRVHEIPPVHVALSARDARCGIGRRHGRADRPRQV